MKKFSILLMTVLAAFAFVSCSGANADVSLEALQTSKDKEATQNLISGSWNFTCESSDESGGKTTVSGTATFGVNRSVTFRDSEGNVISEMPTSFIVFEGTYYLGDKPSAEDALKLNYSYTLSEDGKTLTLTRIVEGEEEKNVLSPVGTPNGIYGRWTHTIPISEGVSSKGDYIISSSTCDVIDAVTIGSEDPSFMMNSYSSSIDAESKTLTGTSSMEWSGFGFEATVADDGSITLKSGEDLTYTLTKN